MTRHNTNAVRLVEMDGGSYEEYRETLVRDYAADKVRAGVWPKEVAQGTAAKDVDGLLPEGPVTPNHYLYSVRDEALPAEVGVLSISPRDSGVGRSPSRSTISSSTSDSVAEATQAASCNWSKTKPES